MATGKVTVKHIFLEHDHSPESIRARLSAGPRQNYIRDWVYGGVDGSITTFAVVSGVIGAGFSPVVILVMGFANLVADGFSMAASNYLGTKAEHEDFDHLEVIERRHVELNPEGEKEEVRQIFQEKGFTGDDLERVVDLITSDKARWVRTMLTEEYGLPLKIRSAHRAALSTFSAFLLCGLVPLLPFIFGMANAFTMSTILTGIVFFTVGAIKAKWSTNPWWRSGTETLFVGSIAAALAYGVGLLLRGLVQ